MRAEKCQPDTPMGGKQQGTGGFEVRFRYKVHPLLLLAPLSPETGKAQIAQPVLYGMGQFHAARKNGWPDSLTGWENCPFHGKNGQL